MKDAHGHGSDPRGIGGGFSTFKTGVLKDVGVSHDARFSPKAYGNINRTVASMRAQMQNTGAGHRFGLMQGIRNLLGG